MMLVLAALTVIVRCLYGRESVAHLGMALVTIAVRGTSAAALARKELSVSG